MTRPQGNWIAFWLVYFVTLCIGVTLAYLVAAVSPTLAVANAALPSYVVTLLFFTGVELLPYRARLCDCRESTCGDAHYVAIVLPSSIGPP